MTFLSVPKRQGKERKMGITSVTDFGIPIGELNNILLDYSEFIDVVKLAIGSAYITPNLKDKIKLYQNHNIHVYFGGTLFEKSYTQGKLINYINFLRENNITWIEVSSGTINIPLLERLKIVNNLKSDFTVLAEVGSKDHHDKMSAQEWQEETISFLEAGCKYVITEGRDSCTSGIYNKNGELKEDLIQKLVKNINVNKLIFEASSPKHQMYFINRIGANVNLGNVPIRDVLLLESQRSGLRSETFFIDRNKEEVKIF